MYLIEVNEPQRLFFDIFEMKRDHSEWVLKYHIDFNPLSILYPSMVDEGLISFDEDQCRFCIPCLVEDEKERKPRLVIALLGKVILYEIKDMVFKELVEVGPVDVDHEWNCNPYYWSDACRFVENLASV